MSAVGKPPLRAEELFRSVDLARGQAGFGPVADAADVGGLDAFSREGGGDFGGASAAATVEDDFLAGVFREEGFPVFLRAVEIALGEQDGGGGDAGVGPLGGLAAIDEDGGAGSDAFGGFGGGEFRGVGGEEQRGGGEEGGEEVEEFHGFLGGGIKRG